MQWALAILAVAILGVAAIAATGRLGFMPPVVDDTPAPYIPLGEIDANALRQARFTVETRGYSMRQVDALLEQLARQFEASPTAPSLAPPEVRDNEEVAAETDRSI